MKGTEQFTKVIADYIENRKATDELFREKAEAVNRPIEEIVTFILNTVQKSGCCGFSDDEIYSLATHAAEEANIEIGNAVQVAGVVINHHVELTEEEKAEQKANALKRFQDEELARLRTRSQKPKVAPKPQPSVQPELSLFDDF